MDENPYKSPETLEPIDRVRSITRWARGWPARQRAWLREMTLFEWLYLLGMVSILIASLFVSL